MKIAKILVEKTIQPGDVILVEYLKKDLVAVGIQFFEQGKATHALCCLGGTDIVEADVIGVCRTNLYNYLRGQCRLTIRRPNNKLERVNRSATFNYWLDRVGDPYDFWMIAGTVPIFLIRRVLSHFSHDLAQKSLRYLPNILGSHTLNTCAELWLRGARKDIPNLLYGFDAENSHPELLRVEADLDTVDVWEAPILDRSGD